ncbi:MAG: hypothetical protein JSV76_07785 [Candidatus Bathyarchaeota archaeon]|nr:MAG: hypothetical protein JSV76_07785 [Candidatus Bathyarchaeota archaeon]
MAFLIKRPFIYIIIGIVCIVIIIQLSRGNTSVLNPTIDILSVTPIESSILANRNTTITIVLENTDSLPRTAGIRIVYTPTDKLKFYDKINRTILPDPQTTPRNNTIIYPTTLIMQPKEKWTISILVEGLDIGQEAYTYIITLEAWSDGAFSDAEEIKISVTHA